MDISPSDAQMLWLAAALMAGGFATGVLAGLFGVGGGGVLVPVLYDLFGALGVADEIRMHLAVGTSLAIIIPTSLRSFRSHQLRGAVDMDVIRILGPAVAIGVLLGVVIAAFSDGVLLKGVFAASSAFIALKLFAGADRLRLGAALPGAAASAMTGLATGVISTLIGIGGGVYISSYMTLFGRSIHQAIGTSSAFGPIIAIPAALGYVWAGWSAQGLPPGSAGYVNLLGAAIVAPVAVLAAPLGVRIAHGISKRKLEIAFACFLLIICLRFVWALVY